MIDDNDMGMHVFTLPPLPLVKPVLDHLGMAIADKANPFEQVLCKLAELQDRIAHLESNAAPARLKWAEPFVGRTSRAWPQPPSRTRDFTPTDLPPLAYAALWDSDGEVSEYGYVRAPVTLDGKAYKGSVAYGPFPRPVTCLYLVAMSEPVAGRMVTNILPITGGQLTTEKVTILPGQELRLSL